MPMTGVLFVVAAVAGGLTAKVPLRILVGLSSAAVAAGLFVIKPMVNADSGWTALLPTMILLGIGLGLFNPARASISVSVVEPRKAGMSSGMSETFQQVGMALGIAAFGAIYQSRVVHYFSDSAVGRQIGAPAKELGRAIASGGGVNKDVTGSLPADVVPQATRSALAAVVDGLRDVSTVAAVVATVGAVIGFAFIRNRDLRKDALEGPPGARPELEESTVDENRERELATRQVSV
jgi:hypothetical protein